MQITKSDVIDTLMTVDDGLSQTWLVDLRASFHVTPCLDCFATYEAGNLGKVHLGYNHACAIEGIGTMHLTLDIGHDLVLEDVTYIPSIKKSLLSIAQQDLHGHTT